MKDEEWLKKIKVTPIKQSPKKSGTCVVVLTYNSVERIEKFLSIMKGQTHKTDILVVDNSSDREVVDALKKEKISIIFIEGLNVGTSGAFFIGQALAVRMGYEWIINSDDDAYPASSDYVGELLEATKKANALVGYGYQNLYGKLIKDSSIACTAQLTAVHRSVFEKAGYFNPRIWKIMEDIEFKTRVGQLKIPSANVFEAHYDHPISGGWAVGWPAKFLYYSLRNFLMVKQLHLKSMLGLLAHISTVVYAAWQNPKMAGCYLAAVSDFMRGEFYLSSREFDASIRYPDYKECVKLSEFKGKLKFVGLLSENPRFLHDASCFERSGLLGALNSDVAFGSGNFFNQLFLLFRKTYVYDPETANLYLLRERKNAALDYFMFLILTILSSAAFALLFIWILSSHYLLGRNIRNEIAWQHALAGSILDSFSKNGPNATVKAG